MKSDEVFQGLCSSSFLAGELCSNTAELQLEMSLRVIVLKGHRKICSHKITSQFSQVWLLQSKAGAVRTGKEQGLETLTAMDKTPHQIVPWLALLRLTGFVTCVHQQLESQGSVFVSETLYLDPWDVK